MRRSTMRTSRRSRRGMALTVTLLSAFAVVGVGVAMLTVSTATQREYQAMVMRSQRRYLAQTGVAESLFDMSAGRSGNLGTQLAPLPWGPGTFRVSVSDNADGTLTLDAVGRVGNASRAVRAIARETTHGIFDHAMYAGNSSGDANYVLPLAGVGPGADVVNGDMYSGGGIEVAGDAEVNGARRALGQITGVTGEEGVKQPAPDIRGMNYASNNDVNVAQAFAQSGVLRTRSVFGGTAYEVPESNPAHIFRLNPTDRRTEIQSTQKNDYFLEDPYQPVSTSRVTAADNATPITLSGVGGTPGRSGNRLVYYIDGNLWIHNHKLYSVVFKHGEPEGIQATFIVRGNIYISDNLLLRNPVKDGVALIAVLDPAVRDSGNIYFGDPVFGTLERMEAFMYAENDFHDNNLSTDGSEVVEVEGVMSAGNFVQVDRASRTARTKLRLDFDDRVRDGTLALPGLPPVGGGGTRRTFQVLAEYEVPAGE